MELFHGGFHGCTQQYINGVDFCVKCSYFTSQNGGIDLNNRPLTSTEKLKLSLFRKHNLRPDEYLLHREKMAKK